MHRRMFLKSASAVRLSVACIMPPPKPTSLNITGTNMTLADISPRSHTSYLIRFILQKSGFASPSELLSDEASGFIRPAHTDEERQLQSIGEGQHEDYSTRNGRSLSGACASSSRWPRDVHERAKAIASRSPCSSLSGVSESHNRAAR